MIQLDYYLLCIKLIVNINNPNELFNFDKNYYGTQADYYKINPGVWHQLRNPYDNPCTLVEIQYGRDCVEEDIERY